jgi:hypothetical protein
MWSNEEMVISKEKIGEKPALALLFPSHTSHDITW